MDCRKLWSQVTGIKIAKQRLLGTFVVSWHAARSDLLSGVLTSAYGFSDTELSHELSLDELFTANPISAGSLSCSLGRHLLRIRQLDRARVYALIFRTIVLLRFNLDAHGFPLSVFRLAICYAG